MTRPRPPANGGVPELLVLRALSRGEMHGYELARAVRIITDDRISFQEGACYPTLYALEESGALEARRRMRKGRSRVYYKITARGRRRLEELSAAGRWGGAEVGSALEQPGHA
jgi:PadR family transcriptional regulator, regulatory protein PadR